MTACDNGRRAGHRYARNSLDSRDFPRGRIGAGNVRFEARSVREEEAVAETSRLPMRSGASLVVGSRDVLPTENLALKYHPGKNTGSSRRADGDAQHRPMRRAITFPKHGGDHGDALRYHVV